MEKSGPQSGVIPLVVIVIGVVLVAAGGYVGVRSGLLKLTAAPSAPGSPVNVFDRLPTKSSVTPTPASNKGFSNLDVAGSEINIAPADPEEVTFSFVNYSSSEYGYALTHPQGWSVENVPADDHREIKVKDPQGRAFVLIAAYIDESINSEAAISGAISSREAATRGYATVDNFETSLQGDVGGYIATGTETFNGFSMNFQERGIFGTSGKIILFHGAVVPEFSEIYAQALTTIIESFTLI